MAVRKLIGEQMSDAENIFQVWLGNQDERIRRLVEKEKNKGRSVSEILKTLIYRSMDKRDDQIVKLLEKQQADIETILKVVTIDGEPNTE
jgi:hypothetical protein